MPRIAAIIPTYNRAKFLEPCLISLCEQDLAPDQYEILVVNNASTDDTPVVIARVAARHPRHQLREIIETKQGETPARNRGAKEAQAPLIAFGDDDATMERDWLSRFLARFDEQGETLGKVGGRIEPVWGAPRPTWLTDSMLGLLSAASENGGEARFVEKPLVECNCCYRREAFREIGGFPEHLGFSGNAMLSGGLVIDWLIKAKGYKLFFDPAIVIHHHIHPERLAPKWLRRRYFWQGVSEYAGIKFLEKKGYGATIELGLRLPADNKDWAFVLDENSIDNLEDNLAKLRWLGFSLALSGLVQVAGI